MNNFISDHTPKFFLTRWLHLSRLKILSLLLPLAVQAAPDFTAIAVKGGGLWPQIQCAADGTLLAFGYNAAAHTTLPGDVDALASGMDDAANERGKRQPNDVRAFRSADFGKTWTKTGTFPARVGGGLKPYPFGSIVRGADSRLQTVVYSADEKHANAEAAWLMTSRDDSRSWQESGKIADGIDESVVLPPAEKNWLCVGRTSHSPARCSAPAANTPVTKPGNSHRSILPRLVNRRYFHRK